MLSEQWLASARAAVAEYLRGGVNAKILEGPSDQIVDGHVTRLYKVSHRDFILHVVQSAHGLSVAVETPQGQLMVLHYGNG
jgi:hypothetical protein